MSTAIHTTIAASGRPQAATSDMRTLRAGQALGFVPVRDMVLRVSQGRAWVTLGMGEGGAMQSGDQILFPGQTMVLKAGQSVVIDSGSAEPLVYHFPRDTWAQDNLQRQSGRWFSRFQWGRADGSMLYNV
ncbi:MAG: DUF2917 domain-containing protein [Comamonas sp.]